MHFQVGPTCLKHNLTPVDDQFNRPSGPWLFGLLKRSTRAIFVNYVTLLPFHLNIVAHELLTPFY